MATKEVESWDDDLELQGPILTQASTGRPGSFSSRRSFRSESNAGEDDWNVALAPNDEQSINNAISSAKQAGIPIPSNVPSSALLGGTIKRLGNKKPSQLPTKEDWADDLGISEQDAPTLKIKHPTQIQTPAEFGDNMDDLDWADGSLGVRFGGTRRASKNRSSSISMMSPSAASAGTRESEEDGLGGLILPTGPVDFETVLKKRKDPPAASTPTHGPSRSADSVSTPAHPQAPPKEDYSDIDFGTGDVFDPRKATLNRNVRQNFKPGHTQSPGLRTQASLTFTDKSNGTRIPRPVSTPKASRLEPVYETGATNITRSRRHEPTTTGAQLLRSKRSMPVLRQQQGVAARPQAPIQLYPTTNTGSSQRPGTMRLPHNSRRDSDPSRPLSPAMRMQSRLTSAASPETPTRPRRDVAPASLVREAAAKKTVTRPARKRNYGDGSELDTFDDLPTSAAKESLYMKQPVFKQPPKGLRTQASQSRLGHRDKMTTPLPTTTQPPRSPTKVENLPHFARDTTSSRIAREQKLASGKPRTEGPLMPRTNLPPPQPSNRTPLTSPVANRTGKGPQLVRQLGKENLRHFQKDAEKKGMRWNAALCKWEGNENAIVGFDPPAPPSPPRPALITNVNKSQGVQVVGGMVFDPQRMCWLKLGATPSDPLSPSVGDEDDPFRDIEDLHDTPPTTATASGAGGAAASGDWLVGEEFDLGPEFIRRQREEEEMWRQKVRGWFGEEREKEGESYKWAIQDIAATAIL